MRRTQRSTTDETNPLLAGSETNTNMATSKRSTASSYYNYFNAPSLSPLDKHASIVAAEGQLVDDADIAAGLFTNNNSPKQPPPSSINSTAKSDLDFFEDLVSEPVLVLGVDISHLSKQGQFTVCAIGTFGFSLLYGYLQELISVQLCSRQLGLFLAVVQFTGYTVLAFIMRTFVYAKQQRHRRQSQSAMTTNQRQEQQEIFRKQSVLMAVPTFLYLGLSILRAVDLGMTNLAMQYINYPAKTLMKSSRIVFTMMFGVIISRKSYKWMDYFIVLAMVAGLTLFMHADANSSAVFSATGVLMLTVSLVCDGAISNVSENIMTKYGVGQDEFIFRLYSIALVAIMVAATFNGDMAKGLSWLIVPGTVDELLLPVEQRTWSVFSKIACMTLFSAMGFFGSSCSAAITKNFGALSMSITSTARKATTLFLSFFLFRNVCTAEHILGAGIFITALAAKSLRRKGNDGKRKGMSSNDYKRLESSKASGNMPEGWRWRNSDNNVLGSNTHIDHRQLKKRTSSHDNDTFSSTMSVELGSVGSPMRHSSRVQPSPASNNTLQAHIV